MRFSRFFAILAATVILALLVVFIPAPPALAAPSLVISPTWGTAGTQVTITAANFESYKNEKINIYFGSTEVDGSPIVVPSTGKFNLTFPVPDDALPGTSLVSIKYQGNPLAVTGDTEFTIPAPAITLDKGGGAIGVKVKVSGEGFHANQKVSFTYSDPLLELGPAVDASDLGECSFTFDIPESTGKAHKVVAMDAAGNKAEATINVIPSVVIDPELGAIGDRVKVSGNGFGYKSQYTIDFGDKQVQKDKTDDLGSFEDSFEVPDTDLRAYTVTVSDTEGNTASGTYTVNAGEPSFVFPQWAVYALFALGGIILFFLGMWIGRKFAYSY